MRSKKMIKLPGQPKKPMGAYFLWLQLEGREKIKSENPGCSITEVGKKSGVIWREMGEEEKKQWDVKAKKAKAAYEKENAKWLENGGAKALAEAKKADKQEIGTKKRKASKLPGQPKKPMGAFFLWQQTEGRKRIMGENPGLSIGEVGKRSGEIWREMGEEGKKKWEVKAKKAKAAYDKEYAEWLEDGGADAIAEVKKSNKQAQKSDKQAKKEGGGSSKSKKTPKKITSTKAMPATTSGSGDSFKSKEFIEENSSSDEEEDSDKEDESDAEMNSDSPDNSD